MFYVSKIKIFLIFSICILGGLFSVPNILKEETLCKMPSWLQSTVNLGLELRGGAQLQLEVDLKSATKDYLEHIKDEMRQLLRKEQVGYKNLGMCQDKEHAVSLTLRDVQDSGKAISVLKKIDRSYKIEAKEDMIIVSIPKDVLEERHKQILEQSVEVVRRRVDETGTKEPSILRQGTDRIVLQLPGVENPADVKRLLGKTAKLTFRLVDHEAGHVRTSESGQPIGSAPSGSEILEDVSHIKYDEKGNVMTPKFYLYVKKEVKLTGENLVDAKFTISQDSNQPAVSIQFDTPGAKKFAEISANNIKRQFAMVLDDKIISAPVFNSAISGGSAIISGSFTYKEANELALLLRAGSLPAPLKVVEESVVGPSLGADSIGHGKQGVFYAFLLVSIFMLLCYSVFGGIANVALIFNIVLLFAGLSILQATLTLPGIAGIALTIGMAVDANVLIYERIKEELRLGSKVMVAIQAGYKRAVTTIIDSNLTTLLGASVLYEFGSGPIRGFAVTLALGILISLFTALSLSKAIIYLWVKNKKNLTTLPI
ncbi:MAG: protein translocase subunit SecD [Proteobacteria bacterium]|nr:protein translocase subunit SecD [Pseudomonadota bacterium]